MTTTATNQYTQLETFIATVNNMHQRQSLQKLLARNEAERIYLDRFAGDTFYVRGAINAKTHTRETYQIGIHTDGTLTCSCMDFRLNCRKLNRVCKHICFIVCKYGKIYDTAYFNTPDAATPKRLAPQYRERLLQSGQQLVAAIANPAEIDESLRECFAATATQNGIYNGSSNHCNTQAFIDQSIFYNLDAYKDWDNDTECRVCYDEVKKDATTTVACPQCHQIMHRECMRIWIIENRHITCVACRSPVWKGFRVKSP